MEAQSTANQNDARADRAFAALRTAGTGESDLHTAAARMIADLRHLCRRHRIPIGAVNQQALGTYHSEVKQHGQVGYAPAEADVLEAEPIEVVTITLRGNSTYRASAAEICGEFLEDPDVLIPLWDLLVGALIDGKASEDPGDIPHRTFHVDTSQRPALARQLLALRNDVESHGAVDLADLTAPNDGFLQFLD